MKQKLAIARALMHRPRVLFLDEPTAGLDPLSARALWDDLAALTREDGVTIVLTTHDLADAEAMCTDVGVLQSGQIRTVLNMSDAARRGMSLEHCFFDLVEAV